MTINILLSYKNCKLLTRTYSPARFSYSIKMICTLLIIFTSLAVTAQQKDSTQQPDASNQIKPGDTARPDFVTRIKKIGEQSAKQSIDEFNADRIAIKQDELLEAVKKEMQRAKIYLRNGIDSFGIKTELEKVNKWYTVAVDGVFSNTGTAQTYRNLKSTSNMLLVLLDKVAGIKNELDRYHKDLNNFRYRIDSLGTDSSIFTFSSDSATAMKYLQRMKSMAREVIPTDSSLKQATVNVQELQAQVNATVLMLETGIEEIDVFEKTVYSHTLDREFANLWGPLGYARPFDEILYFSAAKAILILLFYSWANIGKLLLLMALVIAATLYLNSLKKIYIQKEILRADFNGQLILRYPFLSAVMIVLNVFQFLFPLPPFVFNALLWVLSAVSLTFIFRNFITGYWMKVWLGMLVFFIIACTDNLVLQASRTERWGMMALAVTGAWAGVMILWKGRKDELREKWILYSVGLMAVMEAASLIANIFGRYNLSKTLLTAGYLNVVIAIMFLWTVRLINEGLSLAFNVYTKQERKLFYVNFERVGQKAPVFFYVFMVVGWFILFGRNFYSFTLISEPVKNFLSRERKIGEYTFSINNLFIFVLIMVISMVISKIVSYFASDNNTGQGTITKTEKTGIGSWLLLIRIGIISLGLFFAFAAAGIPMDKLAIVVGALGVGIGFGLQTIVNNLVSGLIIAFEKPVNVGDIVEIGGQGGTMKSIGFRSSVISTWDGADVVMPNGDILNAHLVNWTLGGNKRRMSIVVGVAYETNLEKARQTVTELLGADERILHYPNPVVIFKDFNNSSVDVQIFFWVRNFREGFATKSSMIESIHLAFKANGIVIPFPQQDVHIHTAVADNTGGQGNEEAGNNLQTGPKL